MNTLKSVGEKLFKTELANHKVELSVVDDLSKETSSNAISKEKELIALANFYAQKAVKAKTLIKKVEPLKEAAKFLEDNATLRRLVDIEANLNFQIKTGEKNESVLRSLS